MKKPRLPIALLIVGIGLADLAVAVLLDPARMLRRPPSEATLISAEALFLSQVGLAAIWLVVGGSAAWATWRLAVLWAVIAVGSRLLRSNVPLEYWHLAAAAYAITFVTQAACIAVLLVGARYAGFSLADADSEDVAKEPFQFSVRGLLVATAGLSVFLGLLSWALGSGVLGFILDWLPLTLVLELVGRGIGHGAIGLAGLWAVLGRRWPLVRLLVFCLTVAGVGAIYAFATYTPPPAGQTPNLRPICQFSLIVLLHAALLVGYLGMVRLAGLRLMRRK